jgi:hypothetical protein
MGENIKPAETVPATQDSTDEAAPEVLALQETPFEDDDVQAHSEGAPVAGGGGGNSLASLCC